MPICGPDDGDDDVCVCMRVRVCMYACVSVCVLEFCMHICVRFVIMYVDVLRLRRISMRTSTASCLTNPLSWYVTHTSPRVLHHITT